MRLVVDTNILVRCSRGRAMHQVVALTGGEVELLTTDRNVDELLEVLMRVFGLDEREAVGEAARILRPFEIIDGDEYGPFKAIADHRLREGGKSDWPALAAAIARDCAIWSEDVDFFGTGAAVWSGKNVLLCLQDPRKN